MLTPKQQNFADLYMELGNASEAYRQAYNAEGYNVNSLKVKASTMLRHPKIEPYIRMMKDKLAKRTMITKEDLVNKLLLIANDYEDNKEFTNAGGNEDMRKAEVLSSLANSSSSIAALKQISKMLGFDAAEKHEVTVKSEQPLFKPLD